MNNLNSLILEGKMTEISVKGEGKTVLKMSVSRTKQGKDGPEVEESVFEIEAYGRLAEMCEVQYEKGRGIRVVGRLSQSLWYDSDEIPHSRVFVVAEHIEYKPRKAKKEN